MTSSKAALNDEELTKQLRDLSAGPSDEMQRIGNKAADCIEQLVKDVNETHKEAMAWIEKWGAALKSQREAEAKLAKAVDIIKQIIATAHADDYFAWDTALDDGIDFIAELEKTE